ncbi:MAG: hypothetical protein IJF07_03040 [Lachnospiraceae bacterium]|nr:hypothetical protein [Lachnospiraceae bacterium]
MVQRHSIILWRKAEKMEKSFEQISKEAFEVLNIFQEYSQELRPNYLTAKTKKQVKEFDWNYKNFSEQLKTGINKENDRIFKELGYSISFFSSMDEKNSSAFSMTVGNKCAPFYNVLVVDLPLSYDLYNTKKANIISELFKKLIQAYKPFWGCISNKALSRKYGKFLEGNLPTTIHWINYWSESIVNTITMEKIEKLIDENSMISFQNGILSIKETALDLEKEDDIRLHNKLETQLF